MSRPKRGLGQGLSALVPPSESAPIAPKSVEPAPPPTPQPAAHDETQPARPLRWEYAALERRAPKRGKRRRFARIWFSASGSTALLEPRATVLAARSSWSALGLLGAEGWELVGVDKRWFFFKRPAAHSTSESPAENDRDR